jgi:hypothetical protein
MCSRAATASRLAGTELPQNDLERTKLRQRGLEEIEADEGGEPKPVRAVEMREQETGEDEGAREQADIAFECHTGYVVLNIERNELAVTVPRMILVGIHIQFRPAPSREIQKSYDPDLRALPRACSDHRRVGALRTNHTLPIYRHFMVNESSQTGQVPEEPSDAELGLRPV